MKKKKEIKQPKATNFSSGDKTNRFDPSTGKRETTTTYFTGSKTNRFKTPSPKSHYERRPEAEPKARPASPAQS